VIEEALFVCGPIASGKTGLSLAVAEAMGGEIVNGDAFQLYRGLEVLTAAPTSEEKERCPHHLFGVISPEEPMDAALYAERAAKVIREIRARGKVAVVVGGSGLYLKFLTHGVAEAPPADAEIRARLEKWSVEAIYDRLKELDPDEAARQNSRNRRHLSRALEICLITGGRASDLRRNFATRKIAPEVKGLVLSWPRDLLAARIAERTHRMFENGVVEEVANLPENARTIRQAIGVREIEAFWRGELTLAECQTRITIATRQYAKRQRNWFRRESWLRPLDGTCSLPEQVDQLTEWGWV
jgi:tRNA dimethylallyltransferase